MIAMARVRGLPKCRLITTRRRSYRNASGAELVEPDSMLEQSSVVTRRMSRIRESARKRKEENKNRRRPVNTVSMDASMDAMSVFYRCPLCTGTLKKGHRGFIDHIVEVHHANPKKYIENILTKDYTFKVVESEDSAETGVELVIGALNEEEFRKLKDALVRDENKVVQCAKAKYNMMIEKKHEERNRIGEEISTIFVARESNQRGEDNGISRNEEQEVEQRALLTWAADFIVEVNRGIENNMVLGYEQPVRSLADYERDRDNLLSLARELIAGAEWRGKETAVDEMTFWYKCKLCVYRGNRGDLYRGSELFAKHISQHHRISVSFYVNRFISGQEVYIEHLCEAQDKCGHAGSIEAVNAIKECL